MDSTSIQLNGSEIENLQLVDGDARIHFSRAILIKTMTGSKEKTKWWQEGFLVFEQAEILQQPEFPVVAEGGDVMENIYTYRDMIPVPLDSRGRAACKLYFSGTESQLEIEASAVRLEMLGVPKYIEHIRPDDKA